MYGDYHGVKLGSCVICGEKVYREQLYLKSAEGYTHRGCIFGEEATA